MYKKVWTCIYDTVFCYEFGNIITNICCNMTNKVKIIKNLFLLMFWLQYICTPVGGSTGSLYEYLSLIV